MRADSFSYHVTKYFSDYLPNQTAASINTIHSYRDTFVQLLNFFKKEKHIPPEKLCFSDFTPENVEGFLCRLESERGISIATRNQRLAAVHAFFRYIQYREPAGFEQCAGVLAVPFKKTPSPTVGYMSLEEMQILFSIPEQTTLKGLRDLSVLLVLYETGARVQELIDLQVASFRFGSTNQVLLHGKGDKSRIVPINARVASITKKYIKQHGRIKQDDLVFVNRTGGQLTRAGVQYIIDKNVALARKQRPDLFSSKITNHSFRHSKAMHLLEAGVNLVYIRDFLGHSSIMTTEIYARSNPKIKEEHLRKNSASLGVQEKYNAKEKEDLMDWLKKSL